MREQRKRNWVDAPKRPWSTPRVEQIPLSEDVVRLLRRQHSGSPALDRWAKSAD